MTDKRPPTDAPSEYRKKFVAFIDILGFREIVNKTASNNSSIKEDDKQKEIDAIRAVLGLIDDQLKNPLWPLFAEKHQIDASYKVNFQYRQFSDSIFVIIDKDDIVDFSFLIYLVHSLLYRLILSGFYARGGISFGELICDDTALFGTAIIKAYDIERKMAGEARVILSNEATEQYKNFIANTRLQTLETFARFS
jgi:hypothetical protein